MTAKLRLHKDARAAIVTHAERGYPSEVCGFLLGKHISGEFTIWSVMPAMNSARADDQRHRYTITPGAVLHAEQLAGERQLDVLGVYHSHPDQAARPSRHDCEHAAWSGWSYVIVSVVEGRADSIRSWKLREDRSGFDEEELVVEPCREARTDDNCCDPNGPEPIRR